MVPQKNEASAFVALLRACAKHKDLHRGLQVHDDILKMGLLEMCSDALVAMYAKCGALARAKDLLHIHKSRNVFTWTAVIAGYAQMGMGHNALYHFECMRLEGIFPDAVTFTCILTACGNIGAADKGEQIHHEIAKLGLLRNHIALGNALINMYGKCGALAKARQVLVELPVRDVVSWNALIAGYVQHGEGEEALTCFDLMQREGLSPDATTFTCILKACGSVGSVGKGELIHDKIAKLGLLGNNIVVAAALVDMYAKCGALTKARQVLEELPFRDVILWNALIGGYVQHGEGEQALSCLEGLRQEGILPNAVTFICTLKACGSIGAVSKGEQIHEEIAKQGLLQNNLMLGTALVDMYAKCGALTKAWRVLEELPVRNIFSWSALISGYVQHGEGEQALNCFEAMQREGLSPDIVAFVCILEACGSTGAVDKGEKVHNEIAKQGLLGKDSVLGTALVDMYAKFGNLAKAQQVLEELPVRDAIAWNALIAGYVQHGEGEQAVYCFERMQCEGFSPNAATFSCVLSACSRVGLVEDAQMYFLNMSSKYGVKPNVEHYTCMVDLFGRAGHLDKAKEVIEKMPSEDIGVWSAVLGACQKWEDVAVGRWAFEHAIQVDKSDAGVYALMSNIYAAFGMQEEAKKIEGLRVVNKARKKQALRNIFPS